MSKQTPKRWVVDFSPASSPFWYIRNEATGKRVKIGRIGAKRTNYYDKAVREARRRNARLDSSKGGE